MAKVEVINSGVRVSLSWWEKILTYKGNFTLANDQIRGATDDSTFMRDPLVFRTRGAVGIPGLFSFGVFAKKGDRIFASWKYGQEVLVIELQGTKWNRLALGVPSARQLAKEINATVIS